MATNDGVLTFYISRSTYPSESYYDHKVESRPGRLGVLFIPRNWTADVERTMFARNLIADEEGTMFANIKGDSTKETNFTLRGKIGGKKSLSYNRPIGFRCDLCCVKLIFLLLVILTRSYYLVL